MPGYFLDSSAIGKLYHVEPGTQIVQSLLRSGETLYISRLAAVEVPSAFAGKVRVGQLTSDDMALLRSRFRLVLRDRVLRTVAVKAGHFREAERLILLYGVQARLRTLDAVQLAVALDLKERGFIETFVCADKALCKVAESTGFSILNPETSE